MIRKIRKRDGKISDFNPIKITNAIWKAAQAVGGKDHRKAAELTDKVLEMLEKELKKGEIPTVEQVQDCVEKTLIEEGHARTAKAYILYRKQHMDMREIGGLLKDIDVVDGYLSMMDWKVNENSNMSYSLQGLNVYATENIVSHYWLNKIYPPEIGEAHSNGGFHIHDLGTLGAYTYFGKETVVVKINGNVLVTSFENLYNSINAQEKLLSQKDDAWARYPKEIEVLDKDGWTKVQRVVKKAKRKQMRFIKNEGGRSVIVTEDHPMVMGDEIFKEAKNVELENDKLLTVDLQGLLKNEKLFSKNHIYIADELYKKGINDFFIEGMPLEEYQKFSSNLKTDGIISTSNNADSLPNKLELTENLGYFVGFYLAEGWMEPHRIAITQKDTSENQEMIEKFKNGANELGCRVYTMKENDRLQLRVVNTTLVDYLFKEIFNLRGKCKDKCLPNEILNYNKDFVKGIISGLLDGDGSINTSKTSLVIRIASRTMLEQLAIVMNILGFTIRDRNLEGVGTTRNFNGRQITQNYPLYGISFRTIECSLPSFKYNLAQSSSKAWRAESAGWHKVLNNDKTEIIDEYIYDITTDTNTLVVNGMWNHNCVGWDLKDILLLGFRGVSGKIESKPAKHFGTAMMQIVNYLYTLQGEAAGAQALSNFDTLLAPFIKYDGLDYKAVKQEMQKFLFNMNVPTRVGFQSPFTNITMDMTVPSYMVEEPVIIGGDLKDDTYPDYVDEMNMMNHAFAEIMHGGDAKGRPFTFPIPTYNITKDFDWDNDGLDPIWEMTAKYGTPYFSNFINSDMKPDDARSMCCRLRLDNRELRKRGGGLFGANPKTGCYDEKTEVLTENGWKFFKDVEKNEKVFTLAENNEIELQKPNSFFEYDYNNEMYHFKSRSFDLFVTPNHRMLVDNTWTKERKFVEAKDFIPNTHRIPKRGIWNCLRKKFFELPPVNILSGSGPTSRFSDEEIKTIKQAKQEGESIYQLAKKHNCNPVTIHNICKKSKYGNRERVRVRDVTSPLKIKMDEWLKFFGFWLAEGCTDNEKIAKSHGYRTVISQVNKQKRKEIKIVLDSLPFNYALEGEANFVICNKQLWTYLRQFGDKYTKFIPREIKELEPKKLKILFDWMVKGDGHIRNSTGQINYWTSSKKLADDIQEVVLKLGWLATIKAENKNISEIKGRKITSRVVYTIGVHRKSKHFRIREKSIQKKHYKGKVYCLEVPNHTLYVRRNGKPCWCGNSIGVVTINMPRIGYLAKNENEYFERLDHLMELAKESLIIKREVIENLTFSGLHPYSRFYLDDVKKTFGEYWKNHFSTIGLIGMNDSLLNFMNISIGDPDGKKFAEKVMDHMREKMADFQEETGDIYNLEATPAEGASYRLARTDKAQFSDIRTYNQEFYGNGGKVEPYYTNSTQLPVGFTSDIFEALDLQDSLQSKYTGGTVLHIFIGENEPNPVATKKLIRKIADNYTLPYYTITPTFSICPKHGYLAGEHHYCPKCDEEIGYNKKLVVSTRR